MTNVMVAILTVLFITLRSSDRNRFLMLKPKKVL